VKFITTHKSYEIGDLWRSIKTQNETGGKTVARVRRKWRGNGLPLPQ